MWQWIVIGVAVVLCAMSWLMLHHAHRLRMAHRLTNTPLARRELFQQVWRQQVNGSKEFYDVERDGL